MNPSRQARYVPSDHDIVYAVSFCSSFQCASMPAVVEHNLLTDFIASVSTRDCHHVVTGNICDAICALPNHRLAIDPYMLCMLDVTQKMDIDAQLHPHAILHEYTERQHAQVIADEAFGRSIQWAKRMSLPQLSTVTHVSQRSSQSCPCCMHAQSVTNMAVIDKLVPGFKLHKSAEKRDTDHPLVHTNFTIGNHSRYKTILVKMQSWRSACLIHDTHAQTSCTSPFTSYATVQTHLEEAPIVDAVGCSAQLNGDVPMRRMRHNKAVNRHGPYPNGKESRPVPSGYGRGRGMRSIS